MGSVPFALAEEKVFRDPIHGYIHVHDQLIWDLIQTPEFQRLHRIHQLGGVMQVYHAAEHSRFAHCLGAYEICRRMIEEVETLSDQISEKEKQAVLCAALLHDIGHGPFSHFFERICSTSHEERGCQLISDPQGNLYALLENAQKGLSREVCAILRHESSNPLLSSLISSQLDCDRMDYLLRDAYETGTSYGHFDLERILRTLRAHQGRLCIKESGVHAVEDYIMARYQSYWQVYLHPDACGYEKLLELFIKRARQIADTLQEPVWQALFAPLASDTISRQQFLLLDDGWIHTLVSVSCSSQDPVLSRLANRIQNRDLPEWEEHTSEKAKTIRQAIERYGLDPEWELFFLETSIQDCLPYEESKDSVWIRANQQADGEDETPNFSSRKPEEKEPIYVLENRGQLVPLSKASAIARALLKTEPSHSLRMYYPKKMGLVGH